MNLPPVTTREEHAAAMTRLEELMIKDPPEGSDEDAELEALATAIEAFEKRVCFKD